MFKLIDEVIMCILSGMRVGFTAFLRVLPIYNELGNIKEEVLACIIGVPVIVVSIVLTLSTIINLFKKIKA